MTEETTPISNNTTCTALVSAAKTYVLNLFNEYGDARLTYHNYRQAAEVYDIVNEIALAERSIPEEQEIAELGAWFYLTGYLVDANNPEETAIKTAEKFLTKQNESNVKKSDLKACLKSFEQNAVPSTKAAKILSDAANAWACTEDLEDKNALLKLELELLQHEKYSKADWTQYCLQRIISAKYYTAYAKEKYEVKTSKNLLIQKSLVEKNRDNLKVNDEEAPLRIFEKIERKLPERATQTFFRANYRNHINLSQIADNKANIMISVNAILISVILSIVSYQNFSERNPAILAPVVIFVIAGLASLIFAVLSARPKVTSINKGKKTINEIRKNIVYFGNYIDLTIEEYEEAMDAVMRDGELMYGNLTRDLYYLGKVLDKKYRLLTLSYNIFMVGFATTVLFFLIALFL